MSSELCWPLQVMGWSSQSPNLVNMVLANSLYINPEIYIIYICSISYISNDLQLPVSQWDSTFLSLGSCYPSITPFFQGSVGMEYPVTLIFRAPAASQVGRTFERYPTKQAPSPGETSCGWTCRHVIFLFQWCLDLRIWRGLWNTIIFIYLIIIIVII